MEPTSDDQYRHSQEGLVPGLEAVRDDVWALGTAMPGGHIPYSLTYLLRSSDGGVHVVDPGYDSSENWNALVSALTRLGARLEDVRSVIVTHLHLDHLGMAPRLRRHTGATLTMHDAELRGAAQGAGPVPSGPVLERLIEAWDVPAARRAEIAVLAAAAVPVAPVDGRALEDEEGLGIPGFDLRAVWTPGHTPGHLCIVDSERRILFSGDHVLPTMHAGIGLGGESATNPLADHAASLDRIAAYDDHEVLPGHGYRFTGLAERARRTRAHHLRRAAEVEALLRVTPTASVWEIASRLTWTAGWQALRGFFLFSALHQTHIHRDYVLRSAT